MIKLSTKIGIAAVLVIVLIIAGSMFIGAQTPTTTVTPTVTATFTPTPSPGDRPGISAFTVNVSQSDGDDKTLADVELRVTARNFNPRQSPSANGGDEVEGMIKYCFDMEMETATPAGSPEPTATATAKPTVTVVTPGASPASPAGSPQGGAAAVPTATGAEMQAIAGQCVLSERTTFTFTNVPEGVHTFLVELVDFNGNPIAPRSFVEIRMEVHPTSGGGLFG